MNHAQAVEAGAVERYLLDEMTELERHRFEAHFFDCLECAGDLRAASLLRDGVRAGLANTGTAPRGLMADAADADRDAAAGSAGDPAGATVVAFRPRRIWSPSVVLPWAAAAVLALAVGYQSLFVVPGLRDQMGPQVLTPVTLRAASRGAEPAVPAPASGPITLAVEVSGVQAGTRLSYDLRTAGGQVAVSGAAEAPSPGVPLLLMVPGSAVASAGSYVLSIRPDAGPATIDYRFSVTEH